MHPILISLLMLATVTGMFLLSGALIALAGRQPAGNEAPKQVAS